MTLCSNSSHVETSINYSNYSADAYSGGIVGYFSSGAISKSYNIGSIKSIGGTHSTSSSSWSKYGYASGICGSASDPNVVIDNCYNAGSISGYGNAGYGISQYGTISNCYNVGAVGTYSTAIGGTKTNCYYLNGTGTGGGTALTETQMKLQSMFVGFDFENTWTLNEFANYPYPQLRENVQDLNESASLVSIVSLPVKTEYFTGDKLNFTGAMVKVVYVSGREEIVEITDAMVSGFDMNTTGEQTVTVTVAGASDTYTINVTERPEVEGLTLVSEPDTKVFAIGTVFDFTGAKAEIAYSGGITEVIDITADMTTGGNINHIGKQTITYTYSGFEVNFDVEVLGISLDKIELTSLPEKLTYLEGQSLNLNGLVVTAVMTNGIKNNVTTGYTVSGYSSEPGNHTVTVEYLGKTATFEVTVENRSLVSLTLNSAPAKFEYVAGEKFDPTGMQIVATYDNGENAVVEDYTVSGFDDVPGIKTVVITVGDQSVSFTVQVLGKVCNELKITSLPTKLNYIEYEAFDKTGLKVQATYNDGTVKEITDYEISGFSSKPGIHTVAISYCGFVETFEVNVSPRILEDLRIKAPEKVAYYLGEEFDATGLVVTALYNNGQEIDVDDYQMGGFDSISAGTKTITVTYGGISRSFAVVVNERSSIETNGHITVGKAVGRLGETVTLPVIMTNNSGIAGFKNEITFNASNLKFVSAEIAEGFTDGTFIINDEKASEGKLSFVWYGSKDVAKNGVVYNLTFEILETAADGISGVEISFAKNDIGNISGENVSFGAVNGSVDIRSYWLGDLNGDRLCRVADLLSLAQYVAGKQMNLSAKQLLSADVNEDTIIDIHDVIMLQQWILDAGVQETQKASFMSLSGTPDMVISLGEVSGKVGKEVTVPVTVKNNSGLSAFMFEVEYDAEALTFVSAENGEVLDKGTVVTKDNAEKNKVTILWYSANGDVSEDGEIVPLTFKVNDSASGAYDLNVRYIEEDILDENNEAVFCSIVGGKILVGSILSGNVASFFALSDGDPVTLTLSDETGVVDELSTSSGDYEFDSVNAGEYKLTVAKKNHATRTYDITIGDEDAVLDVKINLIGDVNGDGQVKINDYAKVLAVVRGTGTLEGYEAECGDINSDGNIKINDYSKILAHVRGTASLWE